MFIKFKGKYIASMLIQSYIFQMHIKLSVHKYTLLDSLWFLFMFAHVHKICCYKKNFNFVLLFWEIGFSCYSFEDYGSGSGPFLVEKGDMIW